MKAKMKTKTVTEVLWDYVPTDPVTDDVFHITVTGDRTYYDFTYDDVINRLMTDYGDWSFVYNDLQTRYTVTDPLIAFLRQWIDYKNDNMDNWLRIAKAYNSEYNPIHNYDRTEEHTAKSNWADHTSNSGSDSTNQTTPVESTSTHYYNPDNSEGIKITNKSTTFDNENLVDTVSNTTTGYERTTNDLGEMLTTVTRGTEVDRTGNNEITEDTTRTKGNIGITTTQQMIQAEIELRKLDMLTYIIDGFAKHKLILVQGDDDDERCFLQLY